MNTVYGITGSGWRFDHFPVERLIIVVFAVVLQAVGPAFEHEPRYRSAFQCLALAVV